MNTSKNFVYQTAVSSGQEEEFSLELFDYSDNMECEGTPCRKISNFDDLLNLLDELEEHQSY